MPPKSAAKVTTDLSQPESELSPMEPKHSLNIQKLFLFFSPRRRRAISHCELSFIYFFSLS